jgi:hypothetical protein
MYNVYILIIDVIVMIDIKGPLSYSSVLSLRGGVHRGAIALLDINLIWFGYIARLSHAVGRGRGILLVQYLCCV